MLLDRLRYLVDTNVFLEALLEQDKTEEVQSFLQSVQTEQLYVSDFSLYSIGIILFRLGEQELFKTFLQNIVIDRIKVLVVTLEDFSEMGEVARQYKLDFDDAYQYFLAQKYHLQLVSFDKDFDATPRGRKKPTEITR